VDDYLLRVDDYYLLRVDDYLLKVDEWSVSSKAHRTYRLKLFFSGTGTRSQHSTLDIVPSQ